MASTYLAWGTSRWNSARGESIRRVDHSSLYVVQLCLLLRPRQEPPQEAVAAWP
jgi:hypothetical protein